MAEVVEVRARQLTYVQEGDGLTSSRGPEISVRCSTSANPDFALFCSLIRKGGSRAWIRTVMQIDQKQFECFAKAAGLRSFYYRSY